MKAFALEQALLLFIVSVLWGRGHGKLRDGGGDSFL